MPQQVVLTFVADENVWNKILTALVADPATAEYVTGRDTRICPVCHGVVYSKPGEVKCPHLGCTNLEPLT